METNKLKIQVHHIGGIGDCGPTEQMNILKNDVEWIFYDADIESLTKTAIKDKKYRLINKCIGSENSIKEFHIMSNPSASSLLMPAKSAEDYLIDDKKMITWGNHAKPIKNIRIKVNRLKDTDKIDLLSIDTQGTELDILKGTDLSSIMAIICEVEFSQLYEGQALIQDILKKMKEEGFRLCALYNLQYFPTKPYPKPLRGYGFLTVAEALFLKDINRPIALLEEDAISKMLKLAAISVCFDQRDYAIDILHLLEKNRVNIHEIDPNNEIYYMGKFKKAIIEANEILGGKQQWNI